MADQEPFKPDPNGEQDLADNQVVPPVELHEEVNRPTEEPAQNNQTNKLAEQMSRSERGMLRATRVMASFTVVLVIVTIFQAYSFVESERAYLTISDISFIENQPTSKPGGLDILIVLKNSGKHVAQILSVSAVPAFAFPNPAFRESPDYK